MSYSQTVYECDFENEAENGMWKCNMGANAALISRAENKWYIGWYGQHGETEGNGMYMQNQSVNSSGTDLITMYTNERPCVMLAYRDITIEPGQYTLTFDWRGNTNAASGEGIYACIIPETDKTVKLNSGGQVLPDWVKTYKVTPNPLGSASVWQISTNSFTALEAQGNKFKLVFVYYQGGTKVNTPPASCVDNIRILDATKCLPPTNISYTISTTGLDLSWKGNASYYDIKVYDYPSNKWQNFPKVKGKKLTIPNLSEGVVDVYIRSHCDTLTSEYVNVKPFYFNKGERCIDYMALDDSRRATCYTGSFDNPRANRFVPKFSDLLYSQRYYSTSQSGDAPLFTLHYMPDERDPNTDNKLLTKPKDAIASVRLGRYDPSFGACAEYNYVVPDGDRAILMIRYACVLPNPHPDQPAANPKFNLSVLANNVPIHDSCGIVDFTSGMGDATAWNSSTNMGGEVLWKDWTEVAINLREYVGQSIKIRLTSIGCEFGAHGGYAYFTLSCEDGNLSGINCGDIPTTQFIAPSGFDYEWYLPDEPDKILGKEQIFNVDPMDTLTYNVDIISKTNNRCYYTLDATAVPRFPVAEAEYSISDDYCSNTVLFHQTCHIKYKNQVTSHEWHTDKPVETIVWDFGDGTILESNNEYVTHVFPDSGGNYIVTVYAGIQEDLCKVSYSMNLSLPDKYVKPIVIHADICEGDCYRFAGSYYCNTYIDTIYYVAQSGCDSLVIFDIIMHEREHFIEGGLCGGEAYDFAGEMLTQSGTYKKQFTNAFGCDSIVTLSLDVKELVKVDIPDTVHICSDSRMVEIPYTYTGDLDSIIIYFDERAKALNVSPVYRFLAGQTIEFMLPADLQPTRLFARLHYATPFCPVPDKTIAIELRYDISVMFSEPGIISLTNEEYSGYTFTSYQWYRDDEPIAGSVYPYVSATTDDIGHVYRVVVTREGEDFSLSTCELVYSEVTAIEDILAGLSDFTVYTVLGYKIGEGFTAEDIERIPRGYYIITDGKNVYKVIR